MARRVCCKICKIFNLLGSLENTWALKIIRIFWMGSLGMLLGRRDTTRLKLSQEGFKLGYFGDQILILGSSLFDNALLWRKGSWDLLWRGSSWDFHLLWGLFWRDSFFLWLLWRGLFRRGNVFRRSLEILQSVTV
jgi:hypothetical protein